MMDESRLTEYYSKIANKLDEMIPCEWERIVLYAEYTGDVGTFGCYFYTADGLFYNSLDIPTEYGVNKHEYRMKQAELMQINEKLWLEFKNAGEETWNAYAFTIDSDRKFRMNYIYELDEMFSSGDRIAGWFYDNCDIVPRGDYAKSKLKKYLEANSRELPDELKNI